MYIKDLQSHINERISKMGLVPIPIEVFLRDITVMQIKGKIVVENGDVKSVGGNINQ